MSGARLFIFKALWFCAALEGHTWVHGSWQSFAVLDGLSRLTSTRGRGMCAFV